MTDIPVTNESLLAEARARGSKALGINFIPQGMDNFAVYAGLIGSALELAKLIQTEERDLQVIESHHEREMAKITSAFKETEAAMQADFAANTAMRDRAFETINMLVAAGQHDIALKFYEMLINGFNRGALETIFEHRNLIASASGTTAKLK